MILNFELENINYLKIEYTINNTAITKKLALKNKEENYFIAVMPIEENFTIQTPIEASLSIVSPDGLYKTNTIIDEILKDNKNIIFKIKNPKTLDYVQNRKHYRVLAEYDCIYTIETEYGIESFNATTYDISLS